MTSRIKIADCLFYRSATHWVPPSAHSYSKCSHYIILCFAFAFTFIFSTFIPKNKLMILINFYIIIFRIEMEKFTQSQSPNHRPNPIETGDACSVLIIP